MVHRVLVVGVPDNGCPKAIGHVGAISRLGVGRYRLFVDGPVATVDVVARSKRFLWVSLGDLAADMIDVNAWGGDDKPTDLQPDEEILVGYARRVIPYAPGEKMTDRHPDSVIAQVVEETIAAHAKPIEPVSANDYVFAPPSALEIERYRLREQGGALYIDTEHGPIKVTADPTLRVDEIRLDNGVGVFHIEPDPPDLAERQAARVAEHQRREAGYMPLKSAPSIPAAPAALGRPIPGIDTRPDGFDQHQVDAARAAMLAPAPPRYPRSR